MVYLKNILTHTAHTYINSYTVTVFVTKMCDQLQHYLVDTLYISLYYYLK